MKNILPRVNKSLKFTPRIDETGRVRYLIEDPVTGMIYEMKEEDHFLLSLLDGQTAHKDIVSSFENKYNKALATDTIEAFIRKLHSMRLLEPDSCKSLPFIPPEPETQTILLGYPDKMIRILEKVGGVFFTKTFLFFLCLLTFGAIGIVIAHAGDFIHELRLFREIWGPGFLMMIPILGYLIIYPFSAIAKSITCRHFGGQVSGFHIAFILRFIPDIIADISDALWLMEKPQRMKIFWSGILSLLFLWDISVIIWQSTLPWTDIHLFFILFSLSAFVYMILNMNPLVARDGYFLLLNWLEVADLKNRAENFVKSLMFFDPKPEPLTTRETRILTIYGFGSYFFRIAITVLFLVLAAFILTEMFAGIGALLFLVLVYLRFENTINKTWLRIPIARRLSSSQAGKIRPRLIIGLGLLILFILVLFLPYPFEVGGEFKVFPTNQLGVRSLVPGEIAKVLVEENDFVKKGQPLVILDDRDIQKKVESIKALLDENNAILNLRKKGAKAEEIAKAEQEVATAEKSYEYSKQEAERFKSMFERKAVPETEYQNMLRKRDLDKEMLELAKSNLALVKSGSQDEEIEALEAKVRRLQLELAHAEDDLLQTTLYSPIDGVIITPYLSQKVGQRLETGELFTVIEDTAKYIAEIEIPEKDITEVSLGSDVKLRTWAEPHKTINGKTIAIGPVAYDKSLPMITRALSQRESLLGKKEILRDQGKVIRVLAEFTNEDDIPKSDVTGYAKIKSEVRPVGLAFTRWLSRLIFVEVWSWIP